jgi:hypothetical protein
LVAVCALLLAIFESAGAGFFVVLKTYIDPAMMITITTTAMIGTIFFVTKMIVHRRQKTRKLCNVTYERNSISTRLSIKFPLISPSTFTQKFSGTAL